MRYSKRAFVGLIRDHRCRIGRIKTVKMRVYSSGSEGEAQDSSGRHSC